MPLISLFTPTHNPQYLTAVHDSILQQQYDKWEWVIVPNGKAIGQIPRQLTQDKRVRVVNYEGITDGIGVLKRYACSRCRGDVLLEMDHDDLLVPGTLPLVAQAFREGAGFIYSDVAVFEADFKSWAYARHHHWESYPITVYGRRYIATKCFPLTPRVLCEVYYAPDHLRAWSRKLYEALGGHDEKMKVGDDHDLVCRTYISGAKCTHIGRCGYLYRWHPENTIKATQPEIIKQVHANKLKHMQPLIREWCRREQLETIDLLPMHRKDPQPAHTYLQLPDSGKAGHIVASDILQFEEPADLVTFFNRAYEILTPGGWLSVTVPSERGMYASQNPFHKIRFNPNSFLYYADGRFARNLPGVNCRYDLAVIEEMFPTDNFKKYGMLVIRAEMCALKGQVHPGPDKI